MTPHYDLIQADRVETRQGVYADVRIGVVHAVPFPDLDRWGDWRNHGGLFGQHGQPPEGLKESYYLSLLRLDLAEADMAGDRTDHAGYDGADSIVFRGKPLGEITATADRRADGSLYFVWGCSYGRTLTKSELDLLRTLEPDLTRTIGVAASTLRAHAVRRIQSTMVRNLKEARQHLLKAESNMETMLKALRKEKVTA